MMQNKICADDPVHRRWLCLFDWKCIII